VGSGPVAWGTSTTDGVERSVPSGAAPVTADSALGRYGDLLSDLADEIPGYGAQLGPGDEAAHLVEVAAGMRSDLTELRGVS
jgi:hypothetical protein